MLVLTVKPGEPVDIGDDITVTVERMQDGQVRLGFEAPKHIRILRRDAKKQDKRPGKDGYVE